MAVRWICLAVLLTSLSLSATAQEPLELHMPDAPPLTFVSFQGGYGMVGDVALAAIARAGYLSHIHVTPWARAQQRVSRGKNLLIIPLSRTPEREALYSWIAPIMPLERAFSASMHRWPTLPRRVSVTDVLPSVMAPHKWKYSRVRGLAKRRLSASGLAIIPLACLS